MNEYQKNVLTAKRQWIESEYNRLVKMGMVSSIVADWIEREGGIKGIKDERLDSFGDLISRTKSTEKWKRMSGE